MPRCGRVVIMLTSPAHVNARELQPLRQPTTAREQIDSRERSPPLSPFACAAGRALRGNEAAYENQQTTDVSHFLC